MAREAEIIKEREKKLEELREQGINPYAYKFKFEHHAADLQRKYANLKQGKKTNDKVKLAGRLVSIRLHGKINFATLQDSTGKIQLCLEERATEKRLIDFFKRFLDIGDIIGVEGIIFRTQRNELTVLVQGLELLTKSLKPLPEKWHGLRDKELRYRKRYLDLLLRPEVKDVFRIKSKLIQAIREFLLKRGYEEVETPILQPIYGGAFARPFETHLEALKMKVYLRISNELYLKRLLVGGYEKIFEFTPDFRNEGIDSLHNPEFLQIETMLAYANYKDNIKEFIDLMCYVTKKIFGKTKISYQGQSIDLAHWKQLTMLDAIKRYADLDLSPESENHARKLALRNNVDITACQNWGEIVDKVFEELVKPKLFEPHIILDHPASVSGLAKVHQKDIRLAERFEPFCAGFELGNSYSEENDPARIAEYWKKTEEAFKKGKLELEKLHRFDPDFIEALQYGMPPASGLGIGIDRLCMLLSNSASIRDVILFPFMKPK